eukprot:scaffold466064_cov26-Prasinocladus_malaysianus.AAC.1
MELILGAARRQGENASGRAGRDGTDKLPLEAGVVSSHLLASLWTPTRHSEFFQNVLAALVFT